MTTVSFQCPFRSCNELITAVFEPEEPTTRDYPGSPEEWWIVSHGKDNANSLNDELHHLNRLETSELDKRCYQIAESSWDNYFGLGYWEFL